MLKGKREIGEGEFEARFRRQTAPLLSLFYATHPLPPSSFIRMARVYPFVPILSQQISLTVKKLVIRPAVDARPCPRTTRLHRHLQLCACLLAHSLDLPYHKTTLQLNKSLPIKLGTSYFTTCID
jgi:hypothetical protein